MLTDGCAAAGDHIDSAGRHARLCQAGRDCQWRQRRQRRRLDHKCAACREARGELPANQFRGIVPGRDRRYNPNRFAQHQALEGVFIIGNNFTKDPGRLRGVKLERAGEFGNFTGCFPDRFALFAGHQARQIISLIGDDLRGSFEAPGSRHGRLPGPGGKGRASGIERRVHLGRRGMRDRAHNSAASRIKHFNALTGAFDPLTVDQHSIRDVH